VCGLDDEKDGCVGVCLSCVCLWIYLGVVPADGVDGAEVGRHDPARAPQLPLYDKMR
jgi:hypothetical protein